MKELAQTADATPAAEAESPAKRIARQLHALRAIGERALALALQAADEAAAIASAPPPEAEEKPARRRGPDPRILFERMARIVREAITLERRILLEQTPDLPRLNALQSHLPPRSAAGAPDHPPALPRSVPPPNHPAMSFPDPPPQHPASGADPQHPRLNRHERRILEKQRRSA